MTKVIDMTGILKDSLNHCHLSNPLEVIGAVSTVIVLVMAAYIIMSIVKSND